jgi:hypothetical protein
MFREKHLKQYNLKKEHQENDDNLEKYLHGCKRGLT